MTETDWPTYAELMRTQTRLMLENARLMEQMVALAGWVADHDPDGLLGGREIIRQCFEQDAMAAMSSPTVAHD